MYKLSIITINYNNAKGLKRTIESVVNQTYKNIEYIVIDGGSSDESVEVINEYKNKFAYCISEKDNGIYQAMNKGIKEAHGEYCLFLNSADYLFSDNVISEVFAHKPIESIIACDMIFDNESGVLEVSKQLDSLSFLYMMRTSIWHPATFIKRDLFNMYGLYNDSYKIAADYDFFLKTTMLESVSYKHLSVALSVFDIKGISSDKKYEMIAQTERMDIQKKYFHQFIIDAANEHNRLIESEEYKLFISLQKKSVFTLYKKLYVIKEFFKSKFKV
jgi:glycosyltransferase involved in cell wall biosynthesis